MVYFSEIGSIPAKNMTLTVHPDYGVSPPTHSGAGVFDFAEVVRAAASTVELLRVHGLEKDYDDEVDIEGTAEMLAHSYASNPEATSRAARPNNIAKLTPEVLVRTRDILDEFGQQVVTRSVEIRHLVTNKLILETENPDARIRMRALELLGKITDVGLFTERSEVTVTHQSTSELKELLKSKLDRLKTVGAGTTSVPPPKEIDLDEELGIVEGEIIVDSEESE